MPRFRVSVLLFLAATVSSCAGSASLTVVATNPEDGQADVPLDRTIAVTFSEPLDGETVDEDSIVVSDDSGIVITGQVLANENAVVFIVPALSKTTQYTVTATTDIQSASGLTLPSDYSFSFVTGETYTDGTSPRDADDKPFGSGRFYSIVEKVEYMLLGLGDDRNVQLIDPYEFNGDDPPPDDPEELLYFNSDHDLVTANQKRAARCSLDDDFHSETAVVSWPPTGQGVLTVYDASEDQVTAVDAMVQLDIDQRPSAAYKGYDIDCGDLDNDGFDEVVVMGAVSGASGDERVGKLWVFDDAVADFALLHSVDVAGEFDPDLGSLGLDHIAVAVGNFDEDPPSEIVFAYYLEPLPSDEEPRKVKHFVLDDASAGYGELISGPMGQDGEIEQFNPGSTRYLRVAAGDVDRDGFDEFVIATAHIGSLGGCRDSFWLADDARDDFALLGESRTRCDFFDGPWDEIPTDVAIADLNGDAAGEMVLWGWIVMYSYWEDEPQIMTPDDAQFCEAEGSLSNLEVMRGRAFSIGDVNGDFREDVVVYNPEGSVEVYGCIERPHYNPDTGELESTTNHLEKIDTRGPYGDPVAFPQVTAVNVDHDSLVTRYGSLVLDPDAEAEEKGSQNGVGTVYQEHSVYFADNRLIAVIAAPPCADDIGQSTENCKTGLGASIGGSVSTGVEVAARAGVLVGIEEEIQGGFLIGTITLQKFEVEVSAEVEVKAKISSKVGIKSTITDFAAHKEDLVVFFTTPYDRYTYGVVSHPDSEYIGHLVTVDVPQRPKILTVTRDYYNQTNGEQMDIEEDILPHTPGDLSTYLRFRDVPTYLLPPYFPLGLVGPATVNQGQGSKALDFEIETELVVGTEVSLNVDSMVKVCGATVCGGVTQGFSIGASAEVGVSASTLFISEVGAIDDDNYATNAYDYGMFAHTNFALDPFGERMQFFIVVNHWVN